MAKVRYAVLENDTTEGTTDTKKTVTIDLPETGIMTELQTNVAYTKTSSNDRPLPDWEAVTKIEVLGNGSRVIKSLSGKQIRALTWFNKGPFTQLGSFWGAGGSQDSYTGLPLYFNKGQGDTTAGLDLGAYANPQMKLTWDTTLTSVDGNTYDAASSPTFRYNIMAKIYDGMPAGFTGRFVQSSQIKDWTVAASTEKNTEIPRGFDLYGLMFGASYKNVGYNSITDHVELDFDNGIWKPIDFDHENLKAAFLSWFPDPVHVGHWTVAASQDDYDTCVMQVNSISSSNTGGTTAAISYDAHEFSLHDVAKYEYDGTAAESQDIGWISVKGWGPQQQFYIPMRELVDGNQDSIPTTAYSRIDFKHKTGSGAGSSAVVKVVAEYLIPNGQ